MRRALSWLPPGVLAALAACVVLTPSGRAGEVGYVEDFALSADRAAALRQLVPGTEDYYYYHALHLLNTGQLDKVRGHTAPWRERFGQTARLTEIETRHALLAYEKDPKASLEYLRVRLNLHFDHQKEIVGAAPDLPIALDPKRIARDTLLADSFGRWQNLDNFEDAALDWLAARELTWERRRHLLQRLARPDVPNLPKLVADDLAAPHTPGFGGYPVHAQMTLPQLEELLRLRPELPTNAAFVRAWAAKLQPGADADWQRDRKVMRDYLTRLEQFVLPLPAVHNPFKAHVLFHRLALDRADDLYDQARFVEYLKLPRNQPYMARAWLERPDGRAHPADLNADYGATTLLPPVRSDEPLVRSYLQHFFLKADSTKEYEPLIDDTYLKHLFVETKVETGQGDPEAWASQLPPDHFARLRDRVDIDFAFTNKTDFAANEPVKLDLSVKNVPALLVKVFEINTSNYYRTQLKEVDTDVNLDGLVANAEETHRSGEPPLRRVARSFEFPKLTKPGVYVIDFIGAGKSSRALVRKGRLRPVVGTGTAGQTVTVVDDAGKPVPGASVWLGGREYRGDESGTATVPFSSEPGRRPVVLGNTEFACLDHIDHQPEGYRLDAGIHVDRESLVTQKVAPVLVRPGLFLNGKPVSVKLLEEVKLRIVSTDHSGISSSTEVPDFKLFEDRESVHEFRVPPRLAALSVTLTAKVKSLSLNQQLDLSAGKSFGLSGVSKTDKIEDLHLARFGADYVVELLGRTGEAKPDRAVTVALKHRDFKEPVRVTLKTDPQGRVTLGPLADVAAVTATGPEGTAHTWALPLDRHTYRSALHAKVGEAVTLPYLGDAGKPTRDELALFEVRGDAVLADRFDRLAIADGLLELRDLAAGDYDLWLKRTGERVRVRVTAGPVMRGHVLGTTRHLETPGLKPTQIATVTADETHLTVRLKDASKFARVHVFATRYLPAFGAFDNLASVRDSGLSGVSPTRPESVYLTGRNIGDEYRYVLDRRGMKKFPGNMLDRPQFLLNPWAVRSTDTGEQQATAGTDFAGRGQPAPTAAIPSPPKSEAGAPPGAGGDFADLDFLADPAAVLANLVPDDDGVIRIDRAKLGPHSVVRVVAVDPLGTTSRMTTLPQQPATFADLRLRDGLDPAKHFTQQKQVTVLEKDKPFVLADVTDSRFEAYDSLAKVYGLYTTLSKDPKLAEFAFLLDWPGLKPEEKRERYSKSACHELHFFLFQKDPEFFAQVVKPYLANKKDKTFLDHWLLGADLAAYLDPWKFGRLNAVERVLLAKRVAGESAKTARHLDDLLRLLPPNPDRTLALFDTAVQGLALDSDATALGVTVTRGLAEADAKKAEKLMEQRGGATFGFPAGGMPGRPGGAGGPA
ncbi:MAG TPA: Ig-like domain-containing protein, partial [Fimbriiglobus sp.]|nr:Ig-like domain-containing protein [Fimbriiglobus sp.]